MTLEQVLEGLGFTESHNEPRTDRSFRHRLDKEACIHIHKRHFESDVYDWELRSVLNQVSNHLRNQAVKNTQEHIKANLMKNLPLL